MAAPSQFRRLAEEMTLEDRREMINRFSSWAHDRVENEISIPDRITNLISQIMESMEKMGPKALTRVCGMLSVFPRQTAWTPVFQKIADCAAAALLPSPSLLPFTGTTEEFRELLSGFIPQEKMREKIALTLDFLFKEEGMSDSEKAACKKLKKRAAMAIAEVNASCSRQGGGVRSRFTRAQTSSLVIELQGAVMASPRNERALPLFEKTAELATAILHPPVPLRSRASRRLSASQRRARQEALQNRDLLLKQLTHHLPSQQGKNQLHLCLQALCHLEEKKEAPPQEMEERQELETLREEAEQAIRETYFASVFKTSRLGLGYDRQRFLI